MKTNESNPVIKGSLSTIIMKLLENNSRMYGYEMTKAVREITQNKMNITEAALYPALHKLLDEGLLETTTEQVDGRMRKYYALTKKGKKETIVKIDALKDALESVQILLNSKLGNE
ncbi:MAG: helix-turn-helix transcriptional regulator [Bacteroidetes bacterium]|nr:helix-turn-helix transcriptional regulator [Bacteroidota bacterium]